jgi:hypothetical protein
VTTLAGHPLLSLSLQIPRAGVWVADAVADCDVDITGAVDMVLAGRTWRGTVQRGGVELGRWRGRVVGGAGRLGAPVGATAFADCDLGAVVTETLRDVGEALSAASGDLSSAVSRWARAEGPASTTVAVVASSLGYLWRVLADGAVWIGADAWSAVDLGAVDVIERDPRHGRWVLAGDGAVRAEPGVSVTIDGAAVRVGDVVHSLEGAALRTTISQADDLTAGAGGDRFARAIGDIARRAVPTLYLGQYPARVVSQRADGTLDVQADDPRVVVPRGIPYRTLAGVRIVFAAGTRVAVAFEGGDPGRPVALLSELGDVTRLAVAGGTHPAARRGHAVRVTIPTGALIPVGSPGGPLPAAPLAVDGTITEGTDVLHLP